MNHWAKYEKRTVDFSDSTIPPAGRRNSSTTSLTGGRAPPFGDGGGQVAPAIRPVGQRIPRGVGGLRAECVGPGPGLADRHVDQAPVDERAKEPDRLDGRPEQPPEMGQEEEFQAIPEPVPRLAPAAHDAHPLWPRSGGRDGPRRRNRRGSALEQGPWHDRHEGSHESHSYLTKRGTKQPNSEWHSPEMDGHLGCGRPGGRIGGVPPDRCPIS